VSGDISRRPLRAFKSPAQLSSQGDAQGLPARSECAAESRNPCRSIDAAQEEQQKWEIGFAVVVQK
jgi:hypothetical protein